MKLTRASSYAIHALAFMAAQKHDQPTASHNVAECVAEYLLTHGVDPTAGAGTGMDAFHWAANRGNLETVRLLIRH
jgi:ankyrin repeat protein